MCIILHVLKYAILYMIIFNIALHHFKLIDFSVNRYQREDFKNNV